MNRGESVIFYVRPLELFERGKAVFVDFHVYALKNNTIFGRQARMYRIFNI
jgi:hypothetical protein